MPTSKPRFIVDEMAGRLARWLRFAGFDTLHRNMISDGTLIGLALREGRIILTRDRRLPAARSLPPHLLIGSPFLDEQLRQVFRELGLKLEVKLVFTRCSECNQNLTPVNRSAVLSRVPPYVYRRRRKFFSCPGCGKIFWKGTHREKVLMKLLSAAGK